ncbi:glycoside hydrolase [Butyrivibrio sp. CB08]|uniref:glycoside hydrolase family 43 protein n=1 Tax=Butyrivibrio sp. CB08 TaxID=2364879 RepID=UPI000EA87440|nr:glycoside hydrolase 43 family protein [Butyrivibrio sp. CB08]RKM62343.1 glycoside hydrolase [Butyrivibrio sp. CB08]
MRYSDLGNGKFQNPVLFADYSDPDVIRVDDTFYLTASSFNYTPGLPILTSKDLVNWELVNYAVDNIEEERFDIPRHSEGIWAPSIRYHDGWFYIYYGMPDEGYYVVRTKDPLGQWEKPVCILPGKGLIDPCPFWDDDGRAYIVHGYAKSRIGFKSILGIFEISPDGLTAISEDRFIFDGNDPRHPAVTIEGPKVYKRDGYYYILAPAGGVRNGYQVALRSRDIHGPYEIRTVMDKGSTVINGPHQGGLVDTQDGKEYFLHFQDRGLYGRICHLQPVSWKEGWPVIGEDGNADGCGEPVFEQDIPVKRALPSDRINLQASDDFPSGRYGLCWQWLGNHRNDFCTATDKENGLRLFALNPSGEDEPIIWKSANVLTQKIIYPMFVADICFDVLGLREGERAGVCMTGGQYITAYVQKNEDSYILKIARSAGSDKDKFEVTEKELSLSGLANERAIDLSELIKDLTIRMTFKHEDEKASGEDMYYQDVNVPYGGREPVLSMDLILPDGEALDLGVTYTPLDHTWVGAKIGIYALCAGNPKDHGYADFSYVRVDEL